GAWVFLGPANMDDGWYMQMARNASESSGYIGNFVYMFNVTENPFVLSQYLLQAWGQLGGWSLWWMRLVPTLCGLATWVLLRILLATLLGRAAKLRAVPWALLIAHLVWYLPYGTTLRPERSEERRVGRGSVSQALSPRRDANQRAAPDATS